VEYLEPSCATEFQTQGCKGCKHLDEDNYRRIHYWLRSGVEAVFFKSRRAIQEGSLRKTGDEGCNLDENVRGGGRLYALQPNRYGNINLCAWKVTWDEASGSE
jgi:hypothetical protein